MMEEAVRGAEQLMGTPFPTTDVILMINDVKHEFPNAGYHSGDHFRVQRYGDSRLFESSVFHEVGHYYFSYYIGPSWLVEGGADLVDEYVTTELIERYLAQNDPLITPPPFGLGGFETREYGLATSTELLEIGCMGYYGLENIHAMSLPDRPVRPYMFLCNYAFGRYLLISLLDLLGDAALSSALRELYLMSLDRDQPKATEEETYRIFLKHTPPGLKEDFRDLYRRIHGGPFIDAEG